MSTKSPWEARVGMLLDSRQHPNFKYSFKPVDGAMYGGQTRIDWNAADAMGRYWLIEVKYLSPGRKSLNMNADISPGQRLALDSLEETAIGVPLLAVGDAEGVLNIYDWRKIRWLYNSTPPPLLSSADAAVKLLWTGPKAWRLIDLYSLIRDAGMLQLMTPMGGVTVSGSMTYPPGFDPSYLEVGSGSVPTMPPSGEPWLPTPPLPSPSTSKPEGSIRTRRKKLLSELSSRK